MNAPDRTSPAAAPASPARKDKAPENLQTMLDPMGIVAPILHAQFAWLSHPTELSALVARTMNEVGSLELHSLERLAGQKVPDVVPAQADDTRFADPAWEQPAWSLLKEWYLFYTRAVQDEIGRAHV